jgi:plastocyanin
VLALAWAMPLAASAQGGAIAGEVKLLAGAEVTSGAVEAGDVVVYLTGLDEPPPAEVAVMTQQDKKFLPSVLPIVKGQSVRFVNADPILHNVFSRSKAREFDLGKPRPKESRDVEFPRTGLVEVYCDIHETMAASILVLPNSRFQRLRKDGTFRLEGVPPGQYTLFAWHRRSEPAKAEVTVTAGKVAKVSLQLAATKLEESHLDKRGKPYRKRTTY